jgi:hypothetical protein
MTGNDTPAPIIEETNVRRVGMLDDLAFRRQGQDLVPGGA